MNIKLGLLFIATLILTSVNAQKTYVPDNNFEQVIIDLGYDNILDDSVLTANIDTVTTLHFEFVNIESLIGIKDFSSLKKLTFWGTTITDLDLSDFTTLEHFSASDHTLTNLNLSNNLALTYISFGGDELTQLDVSNCPVLESIGCNNSKLASLDVSTCPSVHSISNINNELTYLNVANGNNTNFTFLRADGNPDLDCIQVDDTTYSNVTWLSFTFAFDSNAVFSEFCGEPVNIIENEVLNHVLIYPNPTTHLLNLDIEEASIYSLYSILGKEVIQSGSLQPGTNQLNLSYLNKGVYTLKVTTKQGITTTKKIIKQ